MITVLKTLPIFGKLCIIPRSFSFLQLEGFTLGVHDILTVRKADRKRKKIIEDSRRIGKNVVAKALGISADASLEEMTLRIEEQCALDPKFRQVRKPLLLKNIEIPFGCF